MLHFIIDDYRLLTMKSAQITKYGNTKEVIEIRQTGPPNLSTGKVLVEVKASWHKPDRLENQRRLHATESCPLSFQPFWDGIFQVSSKRLEFEFPTSNKVTRYMDRPQ